MDKAQAIINLKDQGFKAILDNGIVMIEVANETERSRANKAVKDLDLCGSWGTRGVRDYGKEQEG